MMATETMRPMTRPVVYAHLQRMLRKAMEMDLASEVVRLAFGNYKVPSTSRGGLWHYVTQTVPSEPLVCTCEAQEFTPFCTHKAAVTIRRWAAEGKEVRLNGQGNVEVIQVQDAAALAFDIDTWPALIQDVPPTPPTVEDLSDDDITALLDSLDDG